MIVDRLLRVALMGSTWVLYLLLALSFVSLSAVLERWIFFRRHRDDADALRKKLGGALREEGTAGAERVLAASRSIEAGVVKRALAFADGGADAVADAVDSELSATRRELDRGSNLLGTIGNNGPFVGLFGTVLGVIEAFHHLGDGANKAAMGNVMSGIAEALVATGVGLFVALPAVIAYNVIQKKIGDIEGGVASLSKLVTAHLKREKALGRKVEAAAEEAEAPAPSEAARASRKHKNGAAATV